MNNINNDIDKDVLIQELIQENELKTKWLSLLAHDFKGLFSNITWILDAYEKNVIPQELFLSMLPEIKQNAEKNSKMLNDSFEWVKLHANGFNPQVDEIHVQNLFYELKEYFEEELQAKGITLLTQAEEGLVIRTDRFLLTFILKKGLENAIKYSYLKGVVELEAITTQSRLKILIKDQGVGMGQQVYASLFTLNSSPYTGTMDEKGSGLSLILVKDFIKKLGGEIRVSSEKDGGTIVELLFPI